MPWLGTPDRIARDWEEKGIKLRLRLGVPDTRRLLVLNPFWFLLVCLFVDEKLISSHFISLGISQL